MNTILTSLLLVAAAFGAPNAPTPPSTRAPQTGTAKPLNPQGPALQAPHTPASQSPAFQTPPTGAPLSNAPVLNPPTPSAADGPSHQQTLIKALATFDAAVALKNHKSPQAQELYRAALDDFQQLIDAGYRSGPLYYDIANTNLRLGDLGRAVANYRRALRLSPGDAQTLRNLEFARKLCEIQFATPAAGKLAETVLFWHFGTSNTTRTHWLLACYAAFWLLLAAQRWIGGLGRSFAAFGAMRWPAITLGALTLVLACSVGYDDLVAAKRIEGVVLSHDVTLRKGNGDYYDPQLDRPLQPGVEFRLTESRPDVQGATWYHIELPDGKSGWLRANQADLI